MFLLEGNRRMPSESQLHVENLSEELRSLPNPSRVIFVVRLVRLVRLLCDMWRWTTDQITELFWWIGPMQWKFDTGASVQQQRVPRKMGIVEFMGDMLEKMRYRNKITDKSLLGRKMFRK